ncbi:MAG: hypothetical protein IJG36_04475 [Synergistaceae bacterium]|nr:hypothetical protein [Synergistaceae bacterium]
MTEDEYEEMRFVEFKTLRDRLDEIYNLMLDIEDDGKQLVRLYGDEECRPEFERIFWMLDGVCDRIRGRMNELDVEYPTSPAGREWFSTRQKEAKKACEAGINFSALMWQYIPGGFDECIEYISREGLASLNYDETLKALKCYQDWYLTSEHKQEAV